MSNYAFRKIYPVVKYQKLIVASLVIGFLAAFLAVTLKHMTDHYEEVLFAQSQRNWFYIILFPLFGLSLIYILRKFLFKRKENKGIKEVFESSATGKRLPAYKIPSHFINGLITVSFGGSTGIEVSTVVASAAVGSLAQEKDKFFKKYKTELVCAGVTAGITALFCTPFAGLLFAYEVISKKVSKIFLLTNILAAAIAYSFILLIDEKSLFPLSIEKWQVSAAPWFVLLGVMCGLNGVYLTKCVIFFKKQSQKITSHYQRILIGSAIISTLIFILPQLYGDGYHAIRESIHTAGTLVLNIKTLMVFLGILLLKPIITSVTLSAGGDGGVFAPSLFLGAFIGLFTALLFNTVFDAGVIPINFMVVGMAAMLSAGIHAPFTALFLICGLVGDYSLFIPLLIVSLISKYTAKAIYPYTVYSLSAKK